LPPDPIYDHGRGIRNRLFQSRHLGIAGLQMVFVEPDITGVAPENFRELASRRRVRTGVAGSVAGGFGSFLPFASWVRLLGTF
jgi:hypothetical protein